MGGGSASTPWRVNAHTTAAHGDGQWIAFACSRPKAECRCRPLGSCVWRECTCRIALLVVAEPPRLYSSPLVRDAVSEKLETLLGSRLQDGVARRRSKPER